MKKIFEYADKFIRQSNWKDLALIKLCLCSMGVLGGIALPQKVRKIAICIAGGIFVSTYISLIVKLFEVIKLDKSIK